MAPRGTPELCLGHLCGFADHREAQGPGRVWARAALLTGSGGTRRAGGGPTTNAKARAPGHSLGPGAGTGGPPPGPSGSSFGHRKAPSRSFFLKCDLVTDLLHTRLMHRPFVSRTPATPCTSRLGGSTGGGVSPPAGHSPQVWGGAAAAQDGATGGRCEGGTQDPCTPGDLESTSPCPTHDRDCWLTSRSPLPGARQAATCVVTQAPTLGKLGAAWGPRCPAGAHQAGVPMPRGNSAAPAVKPGGQEAARQERSLGSPQPAHAQGACQRGCVPVRSGARESS